MLNQLKKDKKKLEKDILKLVDDFQDKYVVNMNVSIYDTADRMDIVNGKKVCIEVSI